MPVRRKLRTRATQRAAMRRVRRTRGLRSSSPVFTETIQAGSIISNAGNVFNTTISNIPEWLDYAALYNAYRILRVQILVLPNQNVGQSFDSAPAGGNSAVARLVYAVNDTPGFPAPGSEIDVLSDNGARIKALDKPLRITHRPVAYLAMNDASAPGVVATVSNKSTWLNTNATGAAVVHGGVHYWMSSSIVGTAPTAQIYYRITFQLKDPK